MKQIGKKALTLIITLLLVSLLAFLAFQVIPGDPTTKILGTEATPEARAQLRAELGLEGPVLLRYGKWLLGFLCGDWGISYSYRMGVADMLLDKLPVTFLLTILAFAMTVVVSIPLGVLLGRVRSWGGEVVITAVNQAVMSVPSFFVGILGTYLFGTVLHVYASGSDVSPEQDFWGCVAYLLLPAAAIALPRIAMTVKMLRASIAQELGKDYVRTARSRGAGRWEILLGHVLKNAMLPVISFLAVSAAEILTGSIILEQVFAIPGVSRLLLAAITGRDFPVVQAVVVILAGWIVLVNFLADLLCRWVDPRIRLE